jgi:hypothetical protein
MWRERGFYEAAPTQTRKFYPFEVSSGPRFVSLANDDAARQAREDAGLRVATESLERVLVMSSRARCAVFALGVPVLLGLVLVALLVTLAIMMFMMVMALSLEFNGGCGHQRSAWNFAAAPWVGGMLNAVWISMMNCVYGRVAVWLTCLENHRSESGYESSLTAKTTVFHFFNSYASLVYVMIMKGGFGLQVHTFNAITYFNAFGYTVGAGADTCGQPGTKSFSRLADGRYVFVRADCMRDIWLLMLCLVVFRPIYELALQFAWPRLGKAWRELATRRCLPTRARTGGGGESSTLASGLINDGVRGGDHEERTGGAATDAALLAFRSSLEDQMASEHSMQCIWSHPHVYAMLCQGERAVQRRDELRHVQRTSSTVRLRRHVVLRIPSGIRRRGPRQRGGPADQRGAALLLPAAAALPGGEGHRRVASRGDDILVGGGGHQHSSRRVHISSLAK